MKKIFSCGAILYRENGERKYLLLDHRGHWDFPKGKQEKGETQADTIKREVEEETGIKEIKLGKYKKKIHWEYMRGKEKVFKEAVYRIAKTQEKKVSLNSYHPKYKWCSYKKARELITFKNNRAVLEGAEKFLQKEA